MADDCQHHWLIAPAAGPTSEGCCPRCAAPVEDAGLCVDCWDKSAGESDDVKARRREYDQRDDVKAHRREYMQRDDVKARRREYMREYMREYLQRDDVKAHVREYMREYRRWRRRRGVDKIVE